MSNKANVEMRDDQSIAEVDVLSTSVGASMRAVSTYIALIIAVVVLLAYGAVTVFYSGYLRYFEVPISDINFFPSLPNFAITGFSTIALIVLSMLAAMVLMLLINFLGTLLHRVGARSEGRRWWLVALRWFGEGLMFSKGYIQIVLILAFLFLSFKVVYLDSDKQGYQSAKDRVSFASYVDSAGVKKVVVYQNGGQAVIKTYDESKQSFQKGYEVVDLTGKYYTFTTIK